MKSKLLLAISLFAVAYNATAYNVTIAAKDGFELSAEYQTASDESNKGVLMLHQCNADKEMYSGLAKSLSEQDIHSLALDFRGYGKSTTFDFSLKKMQDNATSREDYVGKVRKMRSEHWRTDVLAAYQYLVDKVGSDNISFIGASCGGVQSILLAKQFKPKSFTFFSSGMSKTIVEDFSQLNDIPALIIASVDDKFTFKSSNEIFLQAKNDETRLVSYKGDAHGKPLFEKDANLEKVMVEWFKQNLK